MNWIWFSLFAAGFLSMAWWMTRLVRASERNEGWAHGSNSETRHIHPPPGFF